MSADQENPSGLNYADWLVDTGHRLQSPEMDPEAQEFGRSLVKVAQFINQQSMALQILAKLTDQQTQEAEEEPANYPEKVLHQDPKAALQMADGEFMEALALLSYRHHQTNKEDPVDSTVEAVSRSTVLFLSTLRNSPELLNKFAMAYNFYSHKVQERMTTGLNALSDTIH